MREINPHAETAIARFASIAATENAYIADEADNLINAALLHDWSVCRVYDEEKLKDAHDALLRRMIIKLSVALLGDPRGIPALDVEQCLDVIRGKSSAHTIMRKVRMTRDGNYLSFEKYPAGLIMSLSDRGCHDEPQTAIFKDGVYSVNPIEKQMQINGIPDSENVTVRFYLPGDRVQDKKLTGIFQEKRIPLPLRKYWPVVIMDGAIISVAGVLDVSGVKTIFPYEG
jgi:tRNA(Ile)-lysidine synthetase-like protein